MRLRASETSKNNVQPLTVITIGQAKENHLILDYDKEKYKEIMLDTAETVLGIFGFDRTLYGKPRNKKWREELRKNSLQDIKAETNF